MIIIRVKVDPFVSDFFNWLDEFQCVSIFFRPDLKSDDDLSLTKMLFNSVNWYKFGPERFG